MCLPIRREEFIISENRMMNSCCEQMGERWFSTLIHLLMMNSMMNCRPNPFKIHRFPHFPKTEKVPIYGTFPMAHPARFERATFRLGGGRSILLSYGCRRCICAAGAHQLYYYTRPGRDCQRRPGFFLRLIRRRDRCGKALHWCRSSPARPHAAGAPSGQGSQGSPRPGGWR